MTLKLSTIMGVFILSQHVFCCLLFPAVAVLAQPPEVVYRADLRSPEYVFINGFPALGNNDNLHDHVTGASCVSREDNTAFVDTTTNLKFVEWWGSHVIVDLSNSTFYIYKIRTNQGFYNCKESLPTTDIRHPGKSVEYHMSFAWLKGRDIRLDWDEWLAKEGIPLEWERWLAKKGIPTSLIEGATEYRQFRKREFQPNPRFVPTSESVHANHKPYHHNYKASTFYRSHRNQLPSSDTKITTCLPRICDLAPTYQVYTPIVTTDAAETKADDYDYEYEVN